MKCVLQLNHVVKCGNARQQPIFFLFNNRCDGRKMAKLYYLKRMELQMGITKLQSSVIIIYLSSFSVSQVVDSLECPNLSTIQYNLVHRQQSHQI
ncbi:hypothetical protein BLOT_005013 [Blomia tropicalis]|nr:hypothetical protein BLOT_005013 [Blomia tropicalis]